jgi:hypothetical protein
MELLRFSRTWVACQTSNDIMDVDLSVGLIEGDEQAGLAALDRRDVEYVRQRCAMSALQRSSFCAACFEFGDDSVDVWTCTGLCASRYGFGVTSIGSISSFVFGCSASVQNGSPRSNESKGLRIMEGMGYQGGGLGPCEQGRQEPISVTYRSPYDKQGIGLGALGSPRLTEADIRMVRDVHDRLGHISPSTLAQGLRDAPSGIHNLPPNLTPALVDKVNRVAQCPVCEVARRTKEDVPEGSGALPAVIGAYFSMDTFGPVGTLTPEGFTNFNLAEELATGCLIAQLGKTTGTDTYQSLNNLLELNQSLGHKVKGLRRE